MSEIEIVCPKCNGTDSYMGLPTANIKGQMQDRPVHLCRKCDIRMYDPSLATKKVTGREKIIIFRMIFISILIFVPILYWIALWSGTI
jgi:hypothetical protein